MIQWRMHPWKVLGHVQGLLNASTWDEVKIHEVARLWSSVSPDSHIHTLSLLEARSQSAPSQPGGRKSRLAGSAPQPVGIPLRESNSRSPKAASHRAHGQDLPTLLPRKHLLNLAPSSSCGSGEEPAGPGRPAGPNG